MSLTHHGSHTRAFVRRSRDNWSVATTPPGDEPFDPHGWVAEDVQGRGRPGGKGLAAAHLMTARGPDGRQMSVERLARGFGQVDFRVLAVATRVEFDRCPICLSPAPTSEEHVPPESLGGTKTTLTCAPCNNGFGSHLEAVLLDWWRTPRAWCGWSTTTSRGRAG